MTPKEALRRLERAQDKYCYPTNLYDFARAEEISYANPRLFEKAVQSLLLSGDTDKVKDGLSNVLFWGFYRMAIRDNRVNRFRSDVSKDQLRGAVNLLRHIEGNGIKEIADLKLPQFSMMPFVSKVRMFLNPESHVVLDNKLAKLSSISTFFGDLKKSATETTIRITKANTTFYERWCRFCVLASGCINPNRYVAVDVERAIFELVDCGRASEAAAMVDALSRRFDL